MFRKVMAVAGVTALTLLSGTIVQPVKAGGLPGVYGTEWTQIANNIELGNINVQTLSQLAQAIQQTTTMLQQAKTMDIQLYSDVFGDIKAVEQVVQAGQGLAYTMGDMDSQWNIRYQLNGTQQPNNYSQQYQNVGQHLDGHNAGNAESSHCAGRGVSERCSDGDELAKYG